MQSNIIYRLYELLNAGMQYLLCTLHYTAVLVKVILHSTQALCVACVWLFMLVVGSRVGGLTDQYSTPISRVCLAQPPSDAPFHTCVPVAGVLQSVRGQQGDVDRCRRALRRLNEDMTLTPDWTRCMSVRLHSLGNTSTGGMFPNLF